MHSGFLAAYDSVKPKVLRLVDQLTADASPEQPWRVYVTGHSLGGALATLAAYDLAGRKCAAGLLGAAAGMCREPADACSQDTVQRQPTNWAAVSYRACWSPALIAAPLRHASLLRRGAAAAGREVTMYTYGAPRVGNAAFAAAFNARLRGRSWRITNTSDIVPRCACAGGRAAPRARVRALQACCSVQDERSDSRH